MKRINLTLFTAAAVAGLAMAGCGRQTRGNADAYDQSRAATPAEGGATSTAGSAGKSENFGDTQAKVQSDRASQTASPTGRSEDASASQPAPSNTPPVKQEPQR